MSNPMNNDGGDVELAADAVVITVTRRKSSANDIIRRNSDTRILGQADLNLAQKIENIRKGSSTKLTG